MNILVTGGLGFIGHRVVELLEAQAHTVIITDTRTDYGIIPRLELDSLIAERRQHIATDRIYRVDVADQAGMTWMIQTHKIDTVVHLASFPRQKVVNANPVLGSHTMSTGLLSLLEASAINQIKKFVYISSSMVYGDFEDQVQEDYHCKPIGQYGILKLTGEDLVKDYHRRGHFDYAIIRPSAVYGPLDVEDRVVAKFMLTAMRGGVLNVNGAGETLDFTYVDDAADGIVAAATLPQSANQTFNITKSHSVSLLEAAKMIVKIVGQGTINCRDKDADFPSRGALNIDRARAVLGYNPQVDVEQGFKNYYKWLSESSYWNVNGLVDTR